VRLTVLTFLFDKPVRWRQLNYDAYTAAHVNTLQRMCAEMIHIPHRFLCLTDQPAGIEATTAPVWPPIFVDGHDSCYRRLRAFDAAWQRSVGTEFILMLDLDVVFWRDATDVIEAAMEHDLTILRGSAYQDGSLCSLYNGGMWLCRAGTRDRIWRQFDPEDMAALKLRRRMPNGRKVLGSDQAWYTFACSQGDLTVPTENRFQPPAVVQYREMRRHHRDGARIVFFAGPQKPWSRVVQKQDPEIHEAWSRFA
jgi:hypothetical protein